jgi:hypothetical protein
VGDVDRVKVCAKIRLIAGNVHPPNCMWFIPRLLVDSVAHRSIGLTPTSSNRPIPSVFSMMKNTLSDQVAHLFADPWPATVRTGFPSPVRGEAHAMPTHNSLGPDDGYGA